MRQMERDQSLEAQQVKSYQPNREALLSALFLVVDGQRFLYHALGDTSEFAHALENLVELLKKALPDSLLTKTLLQTLSDEEKEELATMQLWREKEF
ncbi:hypothetical protein J5893_00135 [bacterium]|nr:hypothetical protein [bacterium]